MTSVYVPVSFDPNSGVISSKKIELKTVNTKMKPNRGQIAFAGNLDARSINKPSTIIARKTRASMKANAKPVQPMSINNLILPSKR